MTMDDVKKSLSRCFKKPDFMITFLDNLANCHPEIESKLADANLVQRIHVLREGLLQLILFAEDTRSAQTALKTIRVKHSKSQLDINPELYTHWLDQCLATMRETDPEWNRKLEEEWKEALTKGIDFIAAGYEA